jgi:hypothetical protein
MFASSGERSRHMSSSGLCAVRAEIPCVDWRFALDAQHNFDALSHLRSAAAGRTTGRQGNMPAAGEFVSYSKCAA